MSRKSPNRCGVKGTSPSHDCKPNQVPRNVAEWESPDFRRPRQGVTVRQNRGPVCEECRRAHSSKHMLHRESLYVTARDSPVHGAPARAFTGSDKKLRHYIVPNGSATVKKCTSSQHPPGLSARSHQIDKITMRVYCKVVM